MTMGRVDGVIIWTQSAPNLYSILLTATLLFICVHSVCLIVNAMCNCKVIAWIGIMAHFQKQFVLFFFHSFWMENCVAVSSYIRPKYSDYLYIQGGISQSRITELPRVKPRVKPRTISFYFSPCSSFMRAPGFSLCTYPANSVILLW